MRLSALFSTPLDPASEMSGRDGVALGSPSIGFLWVPLVLGD